jgi:hypothetical protein
MLTVLTFCFPVPRKKHVEERGQVDRPYCTSSASQACGGTTGDRVEATRKQKHRPPTSQIDAFCH